jgi:hypothetical protein
VDLTGIDDTMTETTRIGLTDTSADADAVQIRGLRQFSMRKKLRIVCSLTDTTRRNARRAIAATRPDLSGLEQQLMFVDVHYGADMARLLRQRYTNPEQ